MIETYLGLGSNQQDPIRQIQLAMTSIKRLPHTRFIGYREIIKTPPFGVIRQARFYNTIVHIETQLTAMVLLRSLQSMEIRLGRRRYLPWGPRIIDIDILIHGEHRSKNEKLILPHPQIWEREFAHQQLLEFNSELIKNILQMQPPHDRKNRKNHL